MRSVDAAALVLLVALGLGCSGRSTGGTCDDAWNRAAAACPNTASTMRQQFLQECDNPQAFKGCESQASAFVDCVKKTSSFTCDSNGQPQGVGCESQTSAFGTCVLGGVVDFDSSTPVVDAAAPETASTDSAASDGCDGRCTLRFVSGRDWDSFDGVLMPDDAAPNATYAKGAALGPAKVVCLTPTIPADCPGAGGAVVYSQTASGWGGGTAIPDAFWIWRGDVSLTAIGDLQISIFERTIELGASPAGFLQIAVDDFAQVFVNDVAVGTVGSISDVALASRDQNAPATVDLTGSLRPGPNKITVVGQNGPGTFAGGCGVGGCTYSQNTAGVAFAGSLSWQ